MIEQFGGDTLPNSKGSKVELEQVYVIQKDKLGKNARMAFLQLDNGAQLASRREAIEDGAWFVCTAALVNTDTSLVAYITPVRWAYHSLAGCTTLVVPSRGVATIADLPLIDRCELQRAEQGVERHILRGAEAEDQTGAIEAAGGQVAAHRIEASDEGLGSAGPRARCRGGGAR